MKAEFYLTLLDGLLATAVYYPHKPDAGSGMPGIWTVSVGEVSGAAGLRPDCSITSLPRIKTGPAELPEEGVSSSATPVCGYRMSLHG